MQDLFRTLQDRDLGHLRIVAELWGIELLRLVPVEAARLLANSMLDPALAAEQADSLPREARRALDALLAPPGRTLLADFVRRFGPLREMGPGRRDREKPWRNPAGPLEVLWYRGWLARAFGETPSGPQEFAFVPSDLAASLPPPSAPPATPPGKPAPPPARPAPALATSADDATTLLAALRRKSVSSLPLTPARFDSLRRFLHRPETAHLLLILLREAGTLVGPPIRPSPEATRRFLDLPRAAASRKLLLAWAVSEMWNDLAHTPGLAAPKDQWPNDPKVGREPLLKMLQGVPVGEWWDLESFVEAVHDRQPGFQRPGGDFDSWYLQETPTGGFLRGFASWHLVEGALIRFVVIGPLHWLGAVDLGLPADGDRPSAFRLTHRAGALWEAEPTETFAEPHGAVLLLPGGRIRLTPTASLSHRYQISRVAQWIRLDDEGYEFRLTPASLQAAHAQGLEAHHVLAILEAAAGRPADPKFAEAIRRAITRGPEAHLERTLILRLNSPRLLQTLQADRACARLLGEPLGPGAVRVAEKDWEKLCAAAARLGLLIEPPAP